MSETNGTILRAARSPNAPSRIAFAVSRMIPNCEGFVATGIITALSTPAKSRWSR